ncbi:GTP binding protein [Phanerochaete sordida]|uniref:GTP binding protein n=1 Tax=Phanerochaete sordida TaxID=48140 RepID=A0A9P3GNU2_9APHY|nr:GTP binding protein [Phanerochaete sordida]
MDTTDQRARREQADYRDLPRHAPDAPPPPRDDPPTDARSDRDPPGYTLMVAGRRTGKTSFLRLLLDTSVISPSATHDQLHSVAKFVQGCAGFTPLVRSVSVNVDQAVADDNGRQDIQTLNLTLIDTPSLDYEDEPGSQQVVNEILRHLDARFSESIEDDRKALTGDHHVHLCIYFLDPDAIVPPSVSVVPPAPHMSRTRNNSLSKPELEPVILEPPVTTNPLLCRPTLPQSDISTIRRLSARVNVLPVIARADALSNDRLAAVKLAVRRDLAAAGIGFGIFDGEIQGVYSYGSDIPDIIVPKGGVDHASPYNGTPNGSSSGGSSPSSTPITPHLLRLPFALISPDIYSHSDGVPRPAPPRHELLKDYMPVPERTTKQSAANKIVRGKWTRTYRWGGLDCMDINHCDFLHLRGAVFYHMRTLQKYTREYLLEKFRVEYQPAYAAAVARMQRSSPVVQRMPQQLPPGARPVLAIDTAPPHAPARHASHSISHSAESGLSSGRTAVNPELSPITSAVGRVRTKKTNVACNFCRSRKLKCDGGRPACSQCFKRSHPCDYTPSHRRRGTKKRKSDDGSESDLEMDMESGDPSGDMEPSMSPDIPSQPHSRRNSNAVDMMMENKLPPIDRPEQHNTVLPPISHPSSMLIQGPQDRGYPMKHELPPIATLPAPTANDMQEMQTLAPLRNQAEMQPPPSQQRRRTSSAASTKGRQNGYGSKIVACNFCRARKTRCDGGHPACSSCARRSLPCNYVNDPSSGNPKGRPRTAGGSSAGPSAPPSTRSSPTAQNHVGPLAGIPNGFIHHIHPMDSAEVELQRSFDLDVPPSKKMRIADDLAPPPMAHAVAVSSAN